MRVHAQRGSYGAGAAAAALGKHVVVEKPLEITLERCDAVIDACDRAGVRLCTIFPSRFTAANLRLKEAIALGRFGRLTLGDTHVKWWRTQEYYDSGGWRGTWKLDGGGALMNQAIHNVDLLYWLMGDVESITATTATLAHTRIEVEDTAVASLRFKNGALGVIEAATSAYPGLLKRTEIHGDRGSARVEQDDITLWEFQEKVPSDNEVLAAMAGQSGFKAGSSDPRGITHIGHRDQLMDFLDAIDNGCDPAVDGREGRKSVEIIRAIYRSADSGRAVGAAARGVGGDDMPRVKVRRPWLDYLVYSVVRSLVAFAQMLSIEQSYELARFLGWVLYHADKRHREVGLDNLKQAYGDAMPEHERDLVIRGVYRHFCHADGDRSSSQDVPLDELAGSVRARGARAAAG